MDFKNAVLINCSCSKAFECVEHTDLENYGLKDVTLRSYQLEGLSWLAQRLKCRHGCILGDEMGLGKTLQAISLLVYMSGKEGCHGPYLILCPLSVVQNWKSELARFSPSLKVLSYTGGKEEREKQRQEIGDLMATRSNAEVVCPFNVMLSHYEVVLKDPSFIQSIPWKCMIIDEGHRLKNSSSVLYGILKQIKVPFHLLLTGTPVQNNLSELYSLLAFVAPRIFPLSAQQTFVTQFSNIKDEGVASMLHFVLQPFLLRRVKSEVLLDLPEKSEVILYTGLSAVQKKLYKAILTKDVSAFGESGSKTRLMNVLVQLRKCVNHPYLFDGVEPEPFEAGEHLIEASGKLFIIDKLLAHLKSRGHRVLMFSQMTRMLDVIQDYLAYRGYTYERLDGSVRGEERFLAVKNFSNDPESFVFLLSTRAGGQGLNLVGADTIIFVDSDFNPQNDLQAAARAHRIGQIRPVKVIRLLGKNTVEEVILKRAYAKLELTATVIEGGQFSHGTTGGIADVPAQLADILKFGLEALLQSDESSIVDEDFESVLGRSENGEWVVSELAEGKTKPGEEEKEEEEEEEEEEEAEKMIQDNIYLYEGQDYSKVNESDRKAFDQLLAEQLKFSETQLGERTLRKEQREPVHLALPQLERKRKPLTPEQLEERRKKREEGKAKKQRLLEEQEQKRLEEKQRKKMEYWKKHNYISLNLTLEEEDEEEEEEEELDTSDRELRYLSGDVTRPQKTGDADAIIIHCVDNSGQWGRGGLFSALAARSPQPQSCYELAGRMRDLKLGDAHLIPIDDIMSRDKGRDMLALIIAQTRGEGGHLSGIKLEALSTGLQRVAMEAKKRGASVHLPRIGYSTPNFNWYGTERLIRKHLASRGIPVYIYYFPRDGAPRNALSNSSVSSSGAQAQSTSSSGAQAQSTSSSGAQAQSTSSSGAQAQSTSSSGAQAQSTSSSGAQAQSSSSSVCDVSLPDLFTGIIAYLHNVCDEDQKRWTRFIVAYNGDVCSAIDDSTTHIITGSAQTPPLPASCKAKVVSTQWLDDCLKRGTVVDVDRYLI